MQIVFDFVIGKLDVDTFKKEWCSNPEIGLWLEGLVDLKTEYNPEWDKLPSQYRCHIKTIHSNYDGSVLKYLEADEKASKKLAEKGVVYPIWVRFGWYFNVIAAILLIAYPDITPTPYYEQETDFLLTLLGEYIGGNEVEDCINDLLDRFPPSMPKTKRKKEAKAALRELFHIEGQKYPIWAQEADWPMGANSPMAYISRNRAGDLVEFTFKDVDTDEIRIIKQLY